jgi:hypothetical protein
MQALIGGIDTLGIAATSRRPPPGGKANVPSIVGTALRSVHQGDVRLYPLSMVDGHLARSVSTTVSNFESGGYSSDKGAAR